MSPPAPVFLHVRPAYALVRYTGTRGGMVEVRFPDGEHAWYSPAELINLDTVEVPHAR